MKPIGVGILCFYGLSDAKRCVEGVRAHSVLPQHRLIFDNSENDEVGEWARHHAADFQYVRSPANVGCPVARNRIAEIMARRGIEHFIVMDQDVTPSGPAWDAALKRVFDLHPDTGIVSWPLFKKQMGSEPVSKDGVVRESPGACCMYSMSAVKAAGGWPVNFGIVFRFDTFFCLVAGKAGFKTRLVQGKDKVSHPKPHQGIKRHPRMVRERTHSKDAFRRELQARGITW